MALVLGILSASLSAEEAEYKIGVLALRGEKYCLKKWKYTAAYLSDKVHNAKFKIVPLDFRAMDEAVKKKEIDFVIADPVLYVEYESKYGLQAIATRKKMVSGVTLTRYGGTIFGIADGMVEMNMLGNLKDANVAAVNQNSLGGWIAAYREFRLAGVNPYKEFKSLRFMGTGDAVVYAVKEGKVDIGIVETGTLEEMESEGKIRIEEFGVLHQHEGMFSMEFEDYPLLHSTRIYPEWPFAKMEHTTRHIAEHVSLALLSIEPDHLAAVVGGYSGWTVPLNYQSVHECLKELRIGPYKDYQKVTLKNIAVNYWPWMLTIACLIAFLFLINLRLSYSQNRLRVEVLQRKKAQEMALREEMLSTSVINSLPGIFYMFGQDKRLVRWNNNFLRISGYSSSELTNMTPSDFFKGADKAVIGGVVEEVFLKGSAEVEASFVAKDGKVIPFYFTGSVIDMEDSKYLIGLGIDIRQRLEMEKELKEKLRALEIFHKAAVGREMKMSQLKEHIAALEEKVRNYNAQA